MNYQVQILPKAQKELNSLSTKIRTRIKSKILALASNPYPSGMKKIQGKKGLFRMRVGDYRIIYNIEDQYLIITIIQVGHRSKIYREL